MTDSIVLESFTLKHMQEDFGNAVLEAVEFRGEITITVSLDKIFEVMRWLKESRGEGFDFLADLCGADYPGRPDRFEVVYNLLKLKTGERIRVKTRVAEHQTVPSVTSLWKAADWMEREAYDMYGIHFTGHPNLTRILMFDGFDGHPLRKDFPVKGNEPPEKRYAADDRRRFED